MHFILYNSHSFFLFFRVKHLCFLAFLAMRHQVLHFIFTLHNTKMFRKSACYYNLRVDHRKINRLYENNALCSIEKKLMIFGFIVHVLKLIPLWNFVDFYMSLLIVNVTKSEKISLKSLLNLKNIYYQFKFSS